jgi:hypothetical protein
VILVEVLRIHVSEYISTSGYLLPPALYCMPGERLFVRTGFDMHLPHALCDLFIAVLIRLARPVLIQTIQLLAAAILSSIIICGWRRLLFVWWTRSEAYGWFYGCIKRNKCLALALLVILWVLVPEKSKSVFDTLGYSR